MVWYTLIFIRVGTTNPFHRIIGVTKLEEVLEDAVLVQECVPEVISIKHKLYEEIDKTVGSQTIISSSTSTFLPSVLSEKMKHRSQLIVSHPVLHGIWLIGLSQWRDFGFVIFQVNPPYFVPLVEIVPSEWTDEWIVKKTRAIMEEVKQSPVTLNKEIPGFALNRIQLSGKLTHD